MYGFDWSAAETGPETTVVTGRREDLGVTDHSIGDDLSLALIPGQGVLLTYIYREEGDLFNVVMDWQTLSACMDALDANGAWANEDATLQLENTSAGAVLTFEDFDPPLVRRRHLTTEETAAFKNALASSLEFRPPTM